MVISNTIALFIFYWDPAMYQASYKGPRSYLWILYITLCNVESNDEYWFKKYNSNTDLKNIIPCIIIAHTCDNSNAKSRVDEYMLQGELTLFLGCWEGIFVDK